MQTIAIRPVGGVLVHALSVASASDVDDLARTVRPACNLSRVGGFEAVRDDSGAPVDFAGVESGVRVCLKCQVEVALAAASDDQERADIMRRFREGSAA